MNQKREGKFVILEGLDGSGTETQTRLLADYFKEKNWETEKLSYPDYDKPIGGIMINKFLNGEYDFSTGVQLLMYIADFVKDKEKIVNHLKNEKSIMLSERYFLSTLAFQGMKGFPIEKAINIADSLELPKPDLIIYLKISPETSLNRKQKEKTNLDIHERNIKLLKKVSSQYDELAKNNIFGKWETTNAEKSINKVFEEIKNILNFYDIK